MQIDERVVDGVTILDLKGKMTLGEGDELLKDKINSLIQQDKKQLLLNLEGVPYIDSAGLGEIVRTYTTVSRQGGKLKLLNLTKRIQDLLAITKLLTVFETYDTEADAIKSFRKSARDRPATRNSRMAHSTLPDIDEPGRPPDRTVSGPVAVGPQSAVSLRPSQWTKNLIVFAGLLFGQRLLDSAHAVGAVRSRPSSIFCALSGVVYLINDVADREADRLHPLKRHRPIASGAVSPALALGVARSRWPSVALAAAFAAARRRSRSSAVAYVALLALYSGPLKHVVIIDVLTIAIGFVLRAAGRRGRRSTCRSATGC